MPAYHCHGCDKILDKSSFYICKTGPKTGKIARPCKECSRKKSKAYVRSSKGRLAYRRKHLKNNYDLTIEQYNQMFVDQNGCCAICGILPEKNGLVVDHNHKTGKVRGLLCTFCNIFTGFVEKNPEKIEQIKSYLGEN